MSADPPSSADVPRPTAVTWVPRGTDTEKPSAARVYDFMLGGSHNFAADREFGRKLIELVPQIAGYAVENRRFLNRAVRQAVRAGYRQFLDIGSGIPTVGNVHQIVDMTRPQRDVRVVYVDNEPVACAHTELMLRTDNELDPRRVHSLTGDLLDYENLWNQVIDNAVIRMDEPIVLCVVAVLHFIKDERNPDEALAFYRDRLPPGSLLILSTMTNEAPVDDDEAAALRAVEALYEGSTNPGQLRTIAEFQRFFGDWPLVEPGLVYAPAWRPDNGIAAQLFERPEQSRILAGVAHKPGPFKPLLPSLP